jgi:cobyrinic acid a,c-diamide synthase
MFHQAVTDMPCRNLDPVLTSPNYVQASFQRHTHQADWVVVEGVMGLFDGIRHLDSNEAFNDYGSTAHIARLLNIPVALVLDCSRLSSSIAAIAYGYQNLDPRVKIAGVILNKVASDRHLELLETALNSINMPILGIIKRNDTIKIRYRHLGLIPSVELPEIEQIFSQLAHVAKTSLNWNQLLPLINNQPLTINNQPLTINNQPLTIKIAIAQDKAFNFYYQDNLDILQELGAELVFWSPLNDQNIPADIQGLYFGGGFPEIFAQQLAANKAVLQQLKQIIQLGIPTYAECGGLMYLCEQLIDLQAETWSMVGVIPSQVTMQAKLTLGYRQAKALQASPLVPASQTVIGHEFHRSQLTVTASSPLWQLQGMHNSSRQLSEGWRIKQLHASYLHLHWGEFNFLAQRFIQCCRNYQT